MIPAGTRVVEYTGERITKAEADRREKLRLARGRRGGDDCVYIFELNARHDLDGRTRRNVARLINHSCAGGDDPGTNLDHRPAGDSVGGGTDL